jgi:hypothetical integral membrane protein (TIGR02206 family)
MDGERLADDLSPPADLGGAMAGETVERFTAYDTSHQVALGVLVVGAFVLVGVGRATREDPEDRVGKGLAVAMLLMTIPLQILYFTPSYWDLQKTLPIQLCDLGSFVSAYALWTHRRWAVGLTYYWGLTLTTQAIITPDLAAVFPHPLFILYWGMHLVVVWAAIYLTWGVGLAPSWHTYRTSLLITAAWAVTIFTFNVAVGTNYGFLNAKPNAASILDLLGEWPTYLLAEVVIVTAVWALATWPWVAMAKARERAAEVTHGT